MPIWEFEQRSHKITIWNFSTKTTKTLYQSTNFDVENVLLKVFTTCAHNVQNHISPAQDPLPWNGSQKWRMFSNNTCTRITSMHLTTKQKKKKTAPWTEYDSFLSSCTHLKKKFIVNKTRWEQYSHTSIWSRCIGQSIEFNERNKKVALAFELSRKTHWRPLKIFFGYCRTWSWACFLGIFAREPEPVSQCHF